MDSSFLKANENGMLTLNGACINSFPSNYITLWETDTPFRNNYSITLNDDLRNYEEYIVYGSAYRVGLNFHTENRYVVNNDGVNLAGSNDYGRWSTNTTYLLVNGTDLYLSGTSGFVASSYYYGQNNGSNSFVGSKTETNKSYYIHPYKIVGIRSVK